MNQKQSVTNIIIGSIILGLANAYLYTFSGLSFFATFAGYSILSFVVMLFLISFIPSITGKKSTASRQPKETRNKKSRNQVVVTEERQPEPEVDMENDDRLSGHIKWYDPRKGFGFLVHGDQEIFFHRHAIRTRHHHFQESDPILFSLEDSDKGPQATAVWLDTNRLGEAIDVASSINRRCLA